MNFKNPVMIAALTMAALCPPAFATSPTPPPASAEPGYEQQAANAAQLLHKAIAAYREEGNAAFARFSRQGEFIDGDQYVYVVDENGYMLASGGPLGFHAPDCLARSVRTVLRSASWNSNVTGGGCAADAGT